MLLACGNRTSHLEAGDFANRRFPSLRRRLHVDRRRLFFILNPDSCPGNKEVEAIRHGKQPRPPYSPDFNPKEKAGSSAAEKGVRTNGREWNAIGRLLPEFTPKKYANVFTAAG
jgi:hypothetical protein